MVVLVPAGGSGASATSVGAAPSSPTTTCPPSAAPAAAPARSVRPATVPSPRAAAAGASSVSNRMRARIETRGATWGGVIITVCGELGRNDSAVLSRQLHSALERGPSVVVVNLRAVSTVDRCAGEILTVARERARAAGIALHVVDPFYLLADEHVEPSSKSKRA